MGGVNCRFDSVVCCSLAGCCNSVVWCNVRVGRRVRMLLGLVGVWTKKIFDCGFSFSQSRPLQNKSPNLGGWRKVPKRLAYLSNNRHIGCQAKRNDIVIEVSSSHIVLLSGLHLEAAVLLKWGSRFQINPCAIIVSNATGKVNVVSEKPQFGALPN